MAAQNPRGRAPELIASTSRPDLSTEERQAQREKRQRWRGVADTARWCAWALFPAAGMLWVATRYNREWFIVDEWEMIGRATGPNSWLHTMFTGYGGHLYALPYWVYRLQVDLVGVEHHWLVYLVFCASLGALQVSVAAVLYRAGLPTSLALLSATMVTYFGPGSQSMTFEWFAGNLSLSLCFFASFIALRDNVEFRTALAIATLLIVAICTDSSEALLGMVFVGTITVLLWPRRLAIVALGPPLIAIVTWLLVDHSGRYASASWGKSQHFALDLVARAAGGLVGGAQLAGWIALAVAIGCVSAALARKRLPRNVVACFIGGLLAASATVTAAAKTKAGYVTVEGLAGSRYAHHVALFLLLAFAPALAATVRLTSRRGNYLVAAIAAAGLVTVFVLNLSPLRSNRHFFEAWSSDTRSSVRRSVRVLVVGCGQGHEPNPRAFPVKAEGSDPFRQIPVHLLRSLLDSGALRPQFGIRPTRAVLKSMCGPSRNGSAR